MTFRETRVEVDGRALRYRESGEGPALVHLLEGDGVPLTRAHALLARQRRLIVPEQAGAGSSTEARTCSSAHLASDMAHASTLARALETLGIDTFDLWGTSSGAWSALALALHAPDRVRALVLDAPPPIRPADATPSVVTSPAGGGASPRMGALPADLSQIEEVAASGASMRSRGAPMAPHAGAPHDEAELERRLRGLAIPTLVLVGTRDDVSAPEAARFYKDVMPSAHLVFVYDAGHAIAADRPDALAEVVGDFLERHEAFVISRAPTVIHR
jgi:pimeloyl-ACP methyl ester carboxylesterase